MASRGPADPRRRVRRGPDGRRLRQGRHRPDGDRVRPGAGLRRRWSTLLRGEGVPKGDALAVARIAGIMGAKQTPVADPAVPPARDLRRSPSTSRSPTTRSTSARPCRTTDRTGVEMEALTAVSVAALTVVDMVKAVDKAAVITDVRVETKTGGKSGDWSRDDRLRRLRGRGRRRLQPRRGRGLRRRDRPAASSTSCSGSASRSAHPVVVPDGDPVGDGDPRRRRRRRPRRAHHRRHRPDPDRPHARGDPARCWTARCPGIAEAIRAYGVAQGRPDRRAVARARRRGRQLPGRQPARLARRGEGRPRGARAGARARRRAGRRERPLSRRGRPGWPTARSTLRPLASRRRRRLARGPASATPPG